MCLRYTRFNAQRSTYSLIESSRTYGASVRFLASVNTLMLPQRATIGECFPTEPTTIRSFTRMDTYMNLLRAATAECLAAFATRERTAPQILIMRMTVTHKSSSVREFLATLVASYHLVAMWYHMPARHGVTIGSNYPNYWIYLWKKETQGGDIYKGGNISYKNICTFPQRNIKKLIYRNIYTFI